MTSFELMAALLPFAATLSEDGGTMEYMNDLQDMTQLSRLLKRHVDLLPQIAAALTGKPMRMVQQQHFLITLKELPSDTLSVLFQLVKLCDACKASFVARTLYTYRPETAAALGMLLHSEIERQEIDLYACDMLRFIASAHAKANSNIPTIRERLHIGKKNDTRTGDEILQSIIYQFEKRMDSKKRDSAHEQQA